MKGERYYARSACRRTDDWPFWFVADRERGGVNTTAEIMGELCMMWPPGAVFAIKQDALIIAAIANALRLEGVRHPPCRQPMFGPCACVLCAAPTQEMRDLFLAAMAEDA